MLERPVIWFSEMHPALVHGAVVPAACRYFWPGLPEGMAEEAGLGAAERFVPQAYPFAEKAAAVCLRDMQAMESAALSGVPLRALSAQEGNARAAKNLAELEDLQAFSQQGECANTTAREEAKARERAQKVLIWAWLLEERVLELQNMTAAYSRDAGTLIDALDVDDAEDMATLLRMQHSSLQVDEGLLPPWALLLGQMAFFLPHEAVLVLSPRVAADMEENISFHAADAALCHTLGCPARAATLPLWQALGKKAPVPHCPCWNEPCTFVICEQTA
jgi:hypothetical protein